MFLKMEAKQKSIYLLLILMTRNIDKRVEVACPIYQENLKQQILETLYISDNDNVKTRLINHDSSK